jgi:hypothetical protein
VGHEQSARASLPSVWRELDALVDDVIAARRDVAAAQARETEVLARAIGLVEARAADRRRGGVAIGNDLPLREVSAELGAAMRVGDRTVQRRIDEAHTLVTRFSATLDAWRDGRIDRAHVATILDEGVVIADEDRRARYESMVLEAAAVESAGRTREIARVVAARVDAEASTVRRTEALTRRGVRVMDLPDGMARLQADLAAPLAYAIIDRATGFARHVLAAEGALLPDESSDPAAEPRTLDQIRADVVADLLLTATPNAHHDAEGAPLAHIRGEIHVTIPVATAAGVDDDPALLVGYGPIDAELARRLMAASPAWNRVLVDLPTGLPVAVDRYRHQPTSSDSSTSETSGVDSRPARCGHGAATRITPSMRRWAARRAPTTSPISAGDIMC